VRFSFLNRFVAFAVIATGSVQASIITYDLTGTLDDGGFPLSVSGQFAYNTLNDAITNWDIPISGSSSAPFCGTVSPCYTFEPGTGASAAYTADLFTFMGPATGGYTNYLYIVPGSTSDPLPIDSYSLDTASYLETVSPEGTRGFAHFTDGSLSPTESAVPEPSASWVLAAAFGAALTILRKRRVS
jgi:hypothetical protein